MLDFLAAFFNLGHGFNPNLEEVYPSEATQAR
jgi:hypothetical protein